MIISIFSLAEAEKSFMWKKGFCEMLHFDLTCDDFCWQCLYQLGTHSEDENKYICLLRQVIFYFLFLPVQFGFFAIRIIV